MTEFAKTPAEAHEALYLEADAAGKHAAAICKPNPMRIGNEIVEDGVCGFAWVNIKPATHSFSRWLKANGLGRQDDYAGGVTIWISDYDQSMQRKYAYAAAFAKVLTDAGYNCYAAERMD